MEFLNLIEITLEASVLVILISIVRGLFAKKLNPNIRYFLWVFVAIRVLIPFKMELSIELPEAWENTPLYTLAEKTETVVNEEPVAENPMMQNTPGLVSPEESEERHAITNVPADMDTDVSNVSEDATIIAPADDALQRTDTGGTKAQPLFIVWLCGVLVMTLYIVINNIRLFLNFKATRQKIGMLQNGIPLYAASGYNCLMGIFFPAVYVDVEHLSNKDVVNDVIRHELQHYKVRDNYWQFLRVVCLILQWHNPFMWWAYFASRKDCELACDARVVRDMSAEERHDYGNSLLAIIECGLQEKQNLDFNTSMGTDKKFLSERIHEIMENKYKKRIVLSSVLIGIIACICFISLHVYADAERSKEVQENADEGMTSELEESAEDDQGAETKVALDIQDYYITNTGDPSNLYYVDENNVLWGCGRNDYGQLGQGTQDYDFHEDMVKIAENVIHVDYSQTGFTIYLTKDHKLYGMGNAGCGALQQYEEIDWSYHVNAHHYTVTSPVLLMEDVVYARCGRDDIACMAEDGSVWIWGTIGWNPSISYFEYEPVEVLQNAVLVTGGLFNHAALLEDGSVWTWGYNYAGNCGVEGGGIVSRPQKVAEDVVMVWTGSIKYNVDCYDITEFEGIYEYDMDDNTIIQKRDGSYWICGANVGNEEKILPVYYEVANWPVICTHEFLPYDFAENSGDEEIVIDEGRREKQVVLEHDNLFEDGVDGFLMDLDRTLSIPSELYTANKLRITFDGDGVIQTIYAFLYGKDDKGETRTYLVDYDSAASKNMTVWIDGRANSTYEAEKRLESMFVILQNAGVEEQIARWQENFAGGIYTMEYVGTRAFQTAAGLQYLPGDVDGDGLQSGISDFTALRSGGSVAGFAVTLSMKSAAESTSIHYIMEPEYTSLQEIVKEAEIQQTEAAKAADGWTIDQANGTMYFFLDEQTGWRLVVIDAALGSRLYALEKTEDGGNSWDTINADPFESAGGVAEGLVFYDEDFGYAGLAGASQSYSQLYVTHDGGLSFEKVTLPMDTVTELPKLGQSLGFTTADYDYYEMPELLGDTLFILAITDKVEKDGILFKSEDRGATWTFCPKE